MHYIGCKGFMDTLVWVDWVRQEPGDDDLVWLKYSGEER